MYAIKRIDLIILFCCSLYGCDGNNSLKKNSKPQTVSNKVSDTLKDTNSVGCADLVFGAKLHTDSNFYLVGEIAGDRFSENKNYLLELSDERIKGLHIEMSERDVLANLCSDIIINSTGTQPIIYNARSGKIEVFKKGVKKDEIYKIRAVNLLFESKGRKDILLDSTFYFRTDLSIPG